ncbi:hypothetical protein BDN72DRAFT_906926 [Pluteus cervinus]|uniref:Uncharacterized protein n=1 Tax=Pluteus cervinus TaxID=181527 RepID=A0ACD2ZXV0_9AGAR|nr:hypothetical protein BDN72DRAFT_906926 [Pluteus cervinus]
MPELMERILAFLSPFDIFHFKQVCQWFRTLGNTFYRHAYNIERILGAFFPNVIASFLSTQKETGAIISGSIALRFFDRLDLRNNDDLDIFIRQGREGPMVEWLLSIGYQAVKTSDKDKIEEDLEDVDDITPPNHDYTLDVIRHERFHHPAQNKDVEIVLSDCSPLVTILRFNLTCTMNFLTHNKAYSLYPHLTFHDYQAIYFPSDYTDGEQDFVRKYESLGWSMVNYRTDVLCNCVSEKPRHLGDRDCWVILLGDPAESSQLIHGPTSLFDWNSWKLRWSDIPFLQFTRLSSPRLKKDYTVHLNFSETVNLADTMRRKKEVFLLQTCVPLLTSTTDETSYGYIYTKHCDLLSRFPD